MASPFRPRPQRTLRRPARVEGVGYWSGRRVSVGLHPAPASSGIVFVRADLTPPVRIPAVVERRVDAFNRTNLAAGGVRVEMVEHVLSSLAGLGIDCCEIRLDGDELPGLDGSAAAYVEAILEAGFEELGSPRRPIVVREPFCVQGEGGEVEIAPPSFEGLSATYELDYGHPAIGRQSFSLEITPDAYRESLAAARTFLSVAEADRLRAAGLGVHVTPADLLVFGDSGPIDNTLRWPDECARHKLLDLVGDLALAGRPIHATVRGRRSGHRLNARVVRHLLAHDAAGWPADSGRRIA
jgi:UDP-3-O-[3-hydroxymyristoyl] N-acetylglucosamine deacetylase